MSLHTSMRVAYTHVRIRHANLFGLCSFVVQIYPLSVTQFLTRNDFYFFIFIFGENNEEEEGTQHGVSVCVCVFQWVHIGAKRKGINKPNFRLYAQTLIAHTK